MNIDKEDAVVAFNEDEHVYWVKGTDKKLISVTTLIESFGQPFDSDFWSKIKAIERLLGDKYKVYKADLLKTRNLTHQNLKKIGVDEEELKVTQQEILNEWEKKNREACERGTKIHKERELECLENATSYVKEYCGGGSIVAVTTNAINSEVNAAYPEILLHYISDDKKLLLAGQADLVVINDGKVHILDYKTNAEIKQHSYYDSRTKTRQMMKFPLGHIEDCNYWHYALQLSTYAWMIEHSNPDLVIQDLTLIHYDHDGNKTPYTVPYLKGEVEIMLNEYKRQLTTKEQYDKLKPIEY